MGVRVGVRVGGRCGESAVSRFKFPTDVDLFEENRKHKCDHVIKLYSV